MDSYSGNLQTVCFENVDTHIPSNHSHVSLSLSSASDLLRRQEELRRMEEAHSQEVQKRKQMELRQEEDRRRREEELRAHSEELMRRQQGQGGNFSEKVSFLRFFALHSSNNIFQ